MSLSERGWPQTSQTALACARKLRIATLDVAAWSAAIVPRERISRRNEAFLQAALPLAGGLSLAQRAALLAVARQPHALWRGAYVPSRGEKTHEITTAVMESMIPLGLVYRDFERPHVMRATEAGRNLARAMRGEG